MKSIVIALAAASALAATGAAHAASPFDGTWKVDLAKSQLAGDTLTYVKTAKGFTASGGGSTYPMFIDGKDHPTVADRTANWSKAADGGWDIVYKANGKALSKAHRTLSADGKTLSTTYEEMRPDGSTVTEKDVYTRVSGTSGLAGKWKSTKVDAVADVETISTPAAGEFRIENPTFKQTISGKLDGSPATVTGPTIPPGASAKYTAKGPAVWEYSLILKGKVMGQGVMKMNADGKSMTDTSWVPGKMDEKAVEVLVKQ